MKYNTVFLYDVSFCFFVLFLLSLVQLLVLADHYRTCMGKILKNSRLKAHDSNFTVSVDPKLKIAMETTHSMIHVCIKVEVTLT